MDLLDKCISMDEGVEMEQQWDETQIISEILNGSHSKDESIHCTPSPSCYKYMTQYPEERRINKKQEKKDTDVSDVQWLNCEECSLKFKTKSRLRSHMVAHGNEWLTCKDCHFRTRYKNSLKKHILVKHDTDKLQSFQCEECQKKLKTKQSFQAHMKFQHGNPDDIQWFECDGCDFRTRIQTTLTHHILRKHTDPDEIQWFACDQCKFKSATMQGLQTHLKRRHLDG